MKYLYLLFVCTSAFFASCEFSTEISEDAPVFMGQFDSIVIAREKGPSVEYFYNNMVHHITFPSYDSLLISADIYEHNDSAVQILLCHQAGFSKGAYMNTAVILSQLGFNSMAIDQRSGEIANGIINETNLRAQELGLPTEYLDARQDIEAAIDYLYDCNGGLPITLVGSSYSSSLALLIGKDNDKVKNIIAFSPGEYLEGIDIQSELDSITKPIFVTSSKLEIQQTSQIVSKVDSNLVTHYKPEVEGIHGARALWMSTEGHKEYWQAFLSFLVNANK